MGLSVPNKICQCSLGLRRRVCFRRIWLTEREGEINKWIGCVGVARSLCVISFKHSETITSAIEVYVIW